MNSLWQEFSDLGKSYYNIDICPQYLFCEDKNEQKRRCEVFIAKHFSDGSKDIALDFPFFRTYKNDGKHVHTVFLYLLGLSLRDLFSSEIRDNLRFIKDLGCWYSDHEFMYSWFMTCLYHDVASCIENMASTKTRYTVEELSDLCLKKNAFNVPHRFSYKTAQRYFVHGAEKRNEQDHGIIGGCLLFDKLMKNFTKKTRGHISEEHPYWTSPDGLNWCLSHRNHFAYVAESIINHNMWTVDSADINKAEEYRRYGLDELIIDQKDSEDKKLSRKNYPLSFMLCLLDTIEPTKRLGDLSPKEIAENFAIEHNNNDTITLQFTHLIRKQPQFWKWMAGIAGMTNWMQVKIDPCSCINDTCSISIHIM